MGNNPLTVVDPEGHGWFGDFFNGLANSTYRPIVQVVQHPILTGKALVNLAAHPAATMQAIRTGVVTTTQQAMAGDGNAIGVAVGTIGMAFIPGAGEVGEGAEAAADLGRLGEAAEAGAAAETAGGAGVVANRAGHGNIGGGSSTGANALTQAEKYLGPGYREIAPGIFRSADGMRQFRMTTADLTGAHGNIGSHVHFESIAPDGRTIIENSYVGITTP